MESSRTATPARRVNRGRRVVIASVVLAAAMLGLLSACGKEEDIAPDVLGTTLLEAEGILVAWCENVRVVVDAGVPLDHLDPAQVRVSGQSTDSADPADPPPPGTLRAGWALDPPPSPTETVEPSTVGPATVDSTAVDSTAVEATLADPTNRAPTAPASTGPVSPPPSEESAPAVNGLAASALDERVGLPAAEPDDSAPPEPPSTDFCLTGRVPTVHLDLEAEVPDLSGVPVGEAVALLAQRGIIAGAPAGYDPAALVEAQSVVAGSVLPLGTEQEAPAVDVAPAEVPPDLKLVSVPDVQNLAVSAGCAILRSEGFECSVLTATGEIEYQPEWEIEAQWPRFPARAAEGATVKVVVTGPTFVVVPSVLDLPYGTACEDLRDARLACRASGDLGRREVAAQSPEPGATVEPGSIVTLEFKPVPWYETWSGRLVLLFVGGIVTGLGGLLVRLAFGGRRRRRA